MKPERLWFGLVLTGTVFETWALRGKRREATLSHLTRRTLHTETIPGRLLFMAGWTWFLIHILRETR